jgi:DNA-binding response OmpR family regulator
MTKKILAADDDQAMTEYYKALLSDAGYEVLTAADATAALIQYRDRKPDLVVLDMEMPGGGGEQVFDVTREVLKAGVPVIFVTGMPERAANFVKSYPKVRVFRKPVKSEELLACVASFLSA